MKNRNLEVTTLTYDKITFLNRCALSMAGMWDTRNGHNKRFFYIFKKIHIGFLITIIIILLVPQWTELYMLWGDLNVNSETLICNVFSINALLKLLSYLLTANTFHEVLTTVKLNWNTVMKSTNPGKEKQKHMLLTMAKSALNRSLQYGFVMYTTATLYAISPVVGMQADTLRIRKYPFFGWYFIDQSSDLIYKIIFVNQVICGFVVGTLNVAVDSIFLVTLYHCTAQLKILQDDLSNLKSTSNNSPELINDLIRRHQKEIRISQKLQLIFNGSSIQQLLVSCIIFCIVGLKLIIAAEDGNREVVIYITFWTLASLQILLYCQPGENLISESSQIGNAVYRSDWTSLDQSSIHKISMIILRSQAPLHISAGNIYDLSLRNFTLVIKYI